MLNSVSLKDERVDSILGIKEYWDDHYNNELMNFNENEDKGEIWFGKSAENRMVRYIMDNVPKDAPILDLGTGNASVLRNLRLKGYTNLTGVDYCEAAVELSRKAAKIEETTGSTKIEFAVGDLIADQTNPALKRRFQVILDKGTWDAISLAGDRNERLKNYRRFVMDCFELCEDSDVETNQYFIIFSCNFTQDELIDLFEADDLVFECDIPPTTVFVFGGKPGTTSTGAVFMKK